MLERRKYAVIIPDGAADEPRPELEGRTPLQAADKPNMDAVAREGVVGLVQTIPDDMGPPGSDLAILSLLGYDPHLYYTGRGALEAASRALPLDPRDVAFRCNLVTSDGATMVDYSAGEVSTDEAHALIALLDQKLSTSRRQFYPGVSYRHLLVWRDGPTELRTWPPHDIVGEPLQGFLPEGEGEGPLRQLIWDSLELLDDHDITRRRREEGKNPANMAWPWGQGRPLQLPAFAVHRGLTGAAIAAVDLVRGIARSAGLDVISVPGATGNLSTDFAAKGRAAVDAIVHHDFVVVHVEAPDEAAHHGDAEGKVWAIEQIDRCIVGPLREALRNRPHRLLVVPDHYTTLSSRTHARPPVPFAMTGPPPDSAETFDEASAASTGRVIEEGHRLQDEFLA